MKQIIFLMVLACASLHTAAQEKKPAQQTSVNALVASVNANSLSVSWSSNNLEPNYWEVQGSSDGQTFSTIGLVMGADPKGDGGTYRFKQQNAKMKSGLKFFRVVHIEKVGFAVASNAILLTK